MHRVLTIPLFLLVLLSGCDKLTVGVRNETRGPLEVQFVFKPGSECSTYESITLQPGQGTGTRCDAGGIESIKVRQGQRECDLLRAQVLDFYKDSSRGSAYPIREC